MFTTIKFSAYILCQCTVVRVHCCAELPLPHGSAKPVTALPRLATIALSSALHSCAELTVEARSLRLLFDPTPYSINSRFIGTFKQQYILQVGFYCFFSQVKQQQFYPLKPSENTPKHIQHTLPTPPLIVSNTSKNTPPNFLNSSLNRLFIEQGVHPSKSCLQVSYMCFYYLKCKLFICSSL